MSRLLTEEEFVIRAIKKLRGKNYKSIHATYSGLNKAIEQYFNRNAVEVINELVEAGKVDMHPTKGGVRLYLPGEMAKTRKDPDSIIQAIIG